MIRFYAPEIETEGMLPETESGHCCRVLRMAAGDRIEVVDGKGHSFTCEIVDARPKGTKVEIIERRDEPRSWDVSIRLAVAPTKNIDRIEWLLEKAVEIGVDRVTLLRCEHSERKNVNTERLLKIMVSAMKQSLKAKLPMLDEGLVSFEKFLSDTDTPSRLMGYCSDSYPRKELVKEYLPGSDVTLLIGPEGDFSPKEVEEAVRAGFVPVTFGKSRLRTETAALYALTAIHILNNVEY